MKNKAMIWTKEALKDIIKSMPMEVKIIHSDNGSEFINAHIQKICREEDIDFTRSRPYRKNDAPYVESKNWTLVRAYTGWKRYDTEEEQEILGKLLKLVSLRYNLFMPTMKLIQRERLGGKIRKRYDIDTPFNRVMEIDVVSEEDKCKLSKLRESIDLIKLSLEIEKLAEELDHIYQKKVRRYNNV